MIIKPIPIYIARPLAITGIVITFPLWGPLIAAIWLHVTIENLFKPMFAKFDGWYFAWLPVECDPWPEDGFKGTVWLEHVWWSANPRGFCHWTRAQPIAPPATNGEDK